jgi:hypothetical protein
MFEKAKLVLKQSLAKLRSAIADSQYSASKIKRATSRTVIIIRADINVVHSFLKTQGRSAVNKVSGLRNVTAYALSSLLCLVLNSEARAGENI